MLTARFDEAFRYARDLHKNQMRKGTSIPYISHLMTVSALVGSMGAMKIGPLPACFTTRQKIKAARGVWRRFASRNVRCTGA